MRLAAAQTTVVSMLALAAAFASAPQAFAAPDEGADRRLLNDLGSREWSRRESAQDQILRVGALPPAVRRSDGSDAAARDAGARPRGNLEAEANAVMSLLESAARSDNPELAYRARFLLSRLDPDLIQCEVYKVELEPEAHCVGVSMAVGPEGEDLLARPLPARAQAPESGGLGPVASGPGYPEEPSYALHCQPLSAVSIGEAEAAEDDNATERTPNEATPPAGFDITASQILSGGARLELRRVTTGRSGTAILRVGEQCLQRKTGIHLERERHPFVTLLRLRSGRRSQVASPSGAEAAYESLVDSLVADARSPDDASRTAALEILSLLRVGKAADLFQAVIRRSPGDAAQPAVAPDDLALAALGLDDTEMLASIANASTDAGPGDARTTEGTAREDLRLRAASRLLRLGDERGLPPLLRELPVGNPQAAHGVMAALADSAVSGRGSSDGIGRLLEAVFSEDFFSHAVWEDAEAENLLAQAARAARTAPEPGRASAQRGLVLLERAARGEMGNAPRLEATIAAWRRLRASLPEATDSEPRLLLRILSTAKEPQQVSEAMNLLEAALGQEAAEGTRPGPGRWSDEELALLLEGLLAPVRGDVRSLLPACAQALLRAARMLSPGPGQLRKAAEALVEAADWMQRVQLDEKPASTPGAGTHPAALYLRQMDEQLGRWAGVPPGKKGTGERAFDSAAWKEWWADDARVAAREQTLAEPDVQAKTAKNAGGSDGAAARASAPLAYYEFDLLLDAARGSESGKSPWFHVVTGRRLELEPGRAAPIDDGAGGKYWVRVERDGPLNPGQAARYRVNSRTYLFSGIPSLTTVATRPLSMTWHETSESYFGSRVLPTVAPSSYRTLYFVQNLDAEVGAPPPGADAEALWRWFVAERLLSGGPATSWDRWNATFNVVRTLHLPEAAPLLREALKTKPTIDLAQHLMELGDDAGTQFLRSELASSNAQSQLLAALALCGAGRPEGLDAFLELAPRQNALVRGQALRVFKAIDGYLERARGKDDDARRKRALGYIFSRLSEGNALAYHTVIFPILAREAGNDFGYDAAQYAQDASTRSKLMEKVLREAQAWWEAEKAR